MIIGEFGGRSNLNSRILWRHLEMWRDRRPFAMLAFAALVIALSACASPQQRALQEIERDLAQEPHKCLPLGWVPQPIETLFIPVDDVEVIPDMWLPPLWEAQIRTSSKMDRATRLIQRMLNHLSTKGLLQRSRTREGYMYLLTFKGMQYYSNGYFHGLNPERAPYLCYSDIVPERVLWVRRISSPSASSSRTFEAAFEWRPGANAAWAKGDKLIESHSVVLSPAATPVIVTLSRDQGYARIEKIAGWPFGTLVDARAWLQQ